MQVRRCAVAAAMCVAVAVTGTQALGQTTERVSMASTGTQPIGGRYTPRPAISADGQVIAFESPVSTLVAGDTNATTDVFVVAGGTITQVRGTGGVQANCSVQRPSVSADGRYVVFDSCASNLVPGDTNNLGDVFRLDRQTGTVIRVSVTSAPANAEGIGPSFAASISPSGRYVAFLSQAANLATGGTAATHVYLRDIDTGTTELVSRASGVSGAVGTSEVRPSVDDYGNVAFASATSNLVTGDTNGVSDVFVRYKATSTTVRVSVSNTGGGQLGSASTRPSMASTQPDNVIVAFETAAPAVTSDANGLTDVYVRNTLAGTTTLMSRTPAGNGGNGHSFEAAISANGQWVAFTSQAADLAGTFDARQDVFRTNVGTLAVERVSAPPGGAPATGDSTTAAVANSGRVVFGSDDPGLVPGDTNGDTDVFAGTPGALERLTQFAGTPTYSGLSARPTSNYDGTVIAYLSSATNLVPGDTNARVDVFVYDKGTGYVDRLPIPTGLETFDADWVDISHDGRWVAFSRGNAASNIGGAYLYDRSTGTTIPVSVASAGGTVFGATQVRISGSGRYVAYVTLAAIDPADTNGMADVYVYDRIAGASQLVSRGVAGVGLGASSSPAISGNGRRIVFASTAANLVGGDSNNRSDIFIRDLDAATTLRLSTVIDGLATTVEGRDPHISADGNYVTFLASSTQLTSEATASSDVYVIRYDGTGLRGPLNGASEGTGTVEGAYDPTLSMFGRFLSFRSYATTLVGGDTNNAADVFGRRILGAGVPAPAAPPSQFDAAQRVSVTAGGAEASGGSGLDTENPQITPLGSVVLFQSGFTNLVAGDTNGMVDAFARTGLFSGGECQFIDATLPGYTAFALAYGLDPCKAGGSPWADPDGDGYTNEEEQNGGGDGDPVLGTFTRYFAEGATKAGGRDFDVRIALANPNATPVTVQLTYQLPSGVPVDPTNVVLQPFERRTVLLDEVPGIAESGPLPSYEFATTVKATAPIGVDRLMSWDKRVYAAHAETGVASPARRWYFAEGATINNFNLFYLLQNPSTTDVAVVEGRYLLTNGTVLTKQYALGPNSRFNVWANVEEINGGTPLAAAEFSAIFSVLSGPAIIAERAMYGGDASWPAGHESAGVTEPATEWFMAEGNAGEFFHEFVLIANPTGSAALVEVDYIVGATNSPQLTPGQTYTKQYIVIPNSRFNIWLNEESLPGLDKPFAVGSTDVSIRVRSVNGVPLIAERAMWWPGNPANWYETHNSPGAARAASRWVLAEGETGGALGWDTYILVSNTSPTPGNIRVRLMLPGDTADFGVMALPGNSRTTLRLHDLLLATGRPTDTQAGVLIEAVGGGLPLVVERAMYRSGNGQMFQVGTNALGTPLP